MKALRPPRGVALLVVMVSVAVVTALTVDLAYQTRVSAQRAANARDELRATYLAKGAVNVSRLVLHFQRQLDGASGAAAAALQTVGGGTPGGAPAVGAAATAGGAGGLAALLGGGAGLNVRLWELIPVNSSVLPMILGGGGGPAPADADPGAEGAGGPPRRTFGDFEGAFEARIEDEDAKINVQQLDGSQAKLLTHVSRLVEMMRDDRWSFLFDEDDANGWRVSRAELLANLRDWIDDNETSSAFTGNLARPFEDGFADENPLYSRLSGEERYQAKNAVFVSNDELHMVAGITDAFMAAFGDQLTVYPGVNDPINVNASDLRTQVITALAMADPAVPQPVLSNPDFPKNLQLALSLRRPLPFLGITPQDFAAAAQSAGVIVDRRWLQGGQGGAAEAFSGTSKTFRIRATGSAGDVTKRIDAVVLFDQRAGVLAQDLGRLVHWNEE
jgi:general secretion pathway protein K